MSSGFRDYGNGLNRLVSMMLNSNGTRLTFLDEAGRQGYFHTVSAHIAVFPIIQEEYYRFPNVGQFAKLALCGVLQVIDRPRIVRLVSASERRKAGALTTTFDKLRSNQQGAVLGICWN
jgi:hypothetical protein